MAAALKLISHKLCPYVQRAVIALTEKGVGRADRYRSRQQAGLVPEDFAARQGAGAACRDRGRRGGAVREQCDLRVHRGDARRRKAASAGCARAGAASRLDGVRLRHSERLGAWRRRVIPRCLKPRGRQWPRSSRRSRRHSAQNPTLPEGTQPGGCGIRADLRYFDMFDRVDRSLGVRRYAEGARMAKGAGAAAERAHGRRCPTIRNCCTRSWCVMTPIC